MHTHRFTLQPYSGMGSRYDCPQCGRRKTFSRYIDTTTGAHLAPHVGRCSRAIHCGYHHTPKQYFAAHPDLKTHGRTRYMPPKPKPTPPPSYIPSDIFKSSMSMYKENNFVQWLAHLFGAEEAGRLAGRYYIGTSKHWRGATVFWQVDINNHIRAGKIMLYDFYTGKRVKEPYSHITWVHSVVNLPGYNLSQVLFGEHLLHRYPDKPVAIVESEKTAIIASALEPGYVWLACGSLNNLTAERCKPLHRRGVTLYPDVNAYSLWCQKVPELSRIATITTCDILERKATAAGRARGVDIADYLLGFHGVARNVQI